MDQNLCNTTDNEALWVVNICNIKEVSLARNINVKSLSIAIFSYDNTCILICLSIWNCKWWLSLMFLSIKPNTVIFDLISTFIIKFEFSSCCVICIHICNCTLSNECSTGNSLSFKLNNPNSSSLWNSFNFYIIGLDQIWILFICLISIRMSWLQIR